MYLQICETLKSSITAGSSDTKSTNYKSANHKKSQIRRLPHLRKVRKSNKLFKSANLRICDLRNGPPTYVISCACMCTVDIYCPTYVQNFTRI
jgi:hypothetical protein